MSSFAANMPPPTASTLSPTSPTFPIQLRLLSLPPKPKTPYPQTSLSYSPTNPLSSPRTARSRSSSPYSSSLSRSVYTPSSPSPTAVSFKSLIASPLSSPTSSVYHSMPSSPAVSIYTAASTPLSSPGLEEMEKRLEIGSEIGGGCKPTSLSTPAALHLAIKSAKVALIFIYSRTAHPPPTISASYASFLEICSLHPPQRLSPTKQPTPRFALSPSLTCPPPQPPRQEVSFFTVCIEDVKSQDNPLMFGRLGCLPSKVMASGSECAVSVQRQGRLWRCAVPPASAGSPEFAGKGLDFELLLGEVMVL